MSSTRTVDKWGNIEYYNESGELHREDGPAYENPLTGNKAWIVNGEYHREDGPAYEDNSGDNSGHNLWMINGKLHREDGPAVVWASGGSIYYLNDEEYTKEEYEHEVTKLKLERIKDL